MYLCLIIPNSGKPLTFCEMKQMTLEQMESLSGGKFWGTACGPGAPDGLYVTIDSSSGGSTQVPECKQTCSYYVLGIAVSTYPNYYECSADDY